ncbi:DNA repair protein RadA [Burkholderia pseudomallei]|uniref:DNA repair protein RadA n=1 Tax=Burkholderia pseudomallei TaxID=28450 RepID=UPI00160B7DAF|nr:DNA repair protein RadA [Burkholderia pseudomallei]
MPRRIIRTAARGGSNAGRFVSVVIVRRTMRFATCAAPRGAIAAAGAPVARRVPYRRRAGCAGPRAVPAGRRAAKKAAGRDGRAECPIARDFHARAAIQPMPKRARTEIIVA